MAEGKPPYHEVRPMLLMVMIPTKPPPTLANGAFASVQHSRPAGG